MTLESFGPLPFWLKGQLFDGYMIEKSETCLKCASRECTNAHLGKLSLCSYGYNFYRLENVCLVGFIVSGHPASSQAREKKLRREKDRLLSTKQFDSILRTLSELEKISKEIISKAKKEVLAEYAINNSLTKEYFAEAQNIMEKAFSNLHDYKQVLVQILQNINVTIEDNYPGNTLEEKIEQASDPEKSIYYAAKLMDDKLEVMKFLKNPTLLTEKNLFRFTRLHGIVFKYQKIYEQKALEKNLHIQLQGTSYNEVFCNPKALGALPQIFLDNAIKYSPPRRNIIIAMTDHKDAVELSVISYGPEIKQSEREKIFTAFYRGEAAENLTAEGSGYGLYLANFIAQNHLKARIAVSQIPENGWHLTTFNVKVPLRP